MTTSINCENDSTFVSFMITNSKISKRMNREANTGTGYYLWYWEGLGKMLQSSYTRFLKQLNCLLCGICVPKTC